MDKPEILYEDNHLFVVVKPEGMLTQDSGTGRSNLEESSRGWIKERDAKPGNVFLHAIHRLDAVASGIVVMAKSRKSLQRLNQFMREGRAEKRYLARVEKGNWPEKGELRHFLRHGAGKAHVFDSPAPDAKEAVLRFRRVEEALLEVELVTGRYHQIRAQLSYAGSPIVGDTLYGAKACNRPGIALCHYRVVFPHPTKDEVLDLAVPTGTLLG